MALKPIKVGQPYDFQNLGQLNLALELLSSDPSRLEGKIHYNSTDHVFKYHDNSAIQIVASKSYVDAQVSAAQNNWDYKEVVRFALTSNIDISTALVDGASLGGVTAATGDRALLTGQTDASENGIYIVAASGAASRSSDANSNAEVTQGMHVEVAEGSLAGAAFLLVTANPITLDTTDLDFIQLTGGGTSYSAGDGLNLTGTIFSVDVSDFAGTGLEDDGSENLRIAASAAGNGLTGGGGSALSVVSDATGGANLAKSVNVSSNGLAIKIDDATIGENGSGRLFVKNSGIGTTQIADDAVTGAKLAAAIFGEGLSFSADVASVDYTAGIYTETFNNSTDWGSADGDGQYTLTIDAATHGFGTDVLVKTILEDDGTNYIVSPIFHQVVKASGDVQLVTSVLFAGKVVLERTA